MSNPMSKKRQYFDEILIGSEFFVSGNNPQRIRPKYMISLVAVLFYIFILNK